MGNNIATGFNPLPSQKQGETIDILCTTALGSVSIRSPHKSKGRHLTLIGRYRLEQFQSAPLTKARGDPAENLKTARYVSFNPLPSQKQGETELVGRLIDLYLSFNPLPSQKQGET